MSYIQIIYEDDVEGNNSPHHTNLELPTHNQPLLLGITEDDLNNDEENVKEFETNFDDADQCNSSHTNNKEGLVEWGIKDTNFLLKKHNRYISFVGSLKRFKTKRDMWHQISQDMKRELNLERTHAQCENRYKTVLRKWRRQRRRMQGVNSKTSLPLLKSRPSSHEDKSNKSSNELVDVLWEIFKKKEESRERRHKEKMEVIWTLIRELNK